jgi:hypothetical protein
VTLAEAGEAVPSPDVYAAAILNAHANGGITLELVEASWGWPDIGAVGDRVIAEDWHAFDEFVRLRAEHPPTTSYDVAAEELQQRADPEAAALFDQFRGQHVVDRVPDEQNEPRKSQSTLLVELALDRFSFGVTDTGEVFAVETAGTNIAMRFRGGRSSLRAALAADFYSAYGKAPSASGLADALAVLEGMAHGEDPIELPLRVARDDADRVIVDIGNADGDAIVVDEAGWVVTARSPVLFTRTNLTLPLPIPVRGDGHDGHDGLLRLRQLLNVTDRAWELVVAWLVAALLVEVPHPILAPVGEQGVGKTTFAQQIGMVIDPTSAPLRSAPRNEDGWAVGAAGSWVVVLDNLSSIQPWLSDALCRAVTGDALVRRMLYTDSDVSVLRFKRAVMLTTIDAGALRGDLAERLIPVELEVIDRTQRRTEAEILAQFRTDHPAILAALLDLCSDVLRVLRTVELAEMPRMADFAKVVAAVDEVMGTDALSTYLNVGSELADDVVEGDPVASAIVEFAEEHGTWSGTPSALLKALTPDHLPKDWPTEANVMSGRLRRAATALRSVGVSVTQSRTGTARTWTIKKENSGISPSPPSSPSPGATDRDGRDGHDGLLRLPQPSHDLEEVP